MRKQPVVPKKDQAAYTTVRIWRETRDMLRQSAEGMQQSMVEHLHWVLAKELTRQAKRDRG